MPTLPHFKRIPTSKATNLRRLSDPAGYVVFLRDVDYGNRYKIARMQEVNSGAIKRATDLAIKIEPALVLEARDAGSLSKALHNQFAGSASPGEWFDLDARQLAELKRIGSRHGTSLGQLARGVKGSDSLVKGVRIIGEREPRTVVRRPRTSPSRSRRALAWLSTLLILLIITVLAADFPQIRREFDRFLDAHVRSTPDDAASRAFPTTWAKRSTHRPPTATRITLSAPEVSLLSKSTTRISFSWSAVRGATGYQYGYIKPGKPNIRWRSASSHAASITGLSPGERVSIYVRALRGSVKSTMARLDVFTVTAPASSHNDIPPTATYTSSPTAAPPKPTNTPSPTDIPPMPTFTATATDIAPRATYTSSPSATALRVLYIRTVNDMNARVRACPGTDCAIVGRLRPGDKVQPIGRVRGQIVYGNPVWIEFLFEGETAFVHSSLVKEAD